MATHESADLTRRLAPSTGGLSKTMVVLAAVLALESLAVLALVGAQAGLGGHFAGWPGRPGAPAAGEAGYEVRLDPRVGAPAPAWRATTIHGQALQQRDLLGRPAAMLFIGPCGLCALARVQQWASLARRSPRDTVLVVTPSTPGDALRFAARLSGPVRVVCDPGGQMALAYNAAWRPRAYAVDERGRLLYCQGDKDTSEAAIASVGRLLKGRAAEEARK